MHSVSSHNAFSEDIFPTLQLSDSKSLAVGSQILMILEPIALSVPEGGSARTLWAIEPAPTRWLEGDWRPEVIAQRTEVPESDRLEDPLPVVVAVEFDRADGRLQRGIVVGGAGWLVTTVADLARSLGGERSILEAPGNRALMLSGTAWLASIDELVPGSGAISATSRIKGLSPLMRTVWAVLLLGVLPAGVFLVGSGVVLARRRA